MISNSIFAPAPRRKTRKATPALHSFPLSATYDTPAVRLMHRVTGHSLPVCAVLASAAGFNISMES